MLFITLKDKSTGEIFNVEIPIVEFFKKSSQFKEVESEEIIKHFNSSIVDSDHLILSLDPVDFKILFSNLPNRNVFNFNYEINEGKSIFDIYASLEIMGFRDIFNNLEIGQSKRYDFYISHNGNLNIYYIFTIYKNPGSILFVSSKNISQGLIFRNNDFIDSSDEGILIVQNDLIVFTNSTCERLLSKSKEELCGLIFSDALNSIDLKGGLCKCIDDINKGYTISRSYELKGVISGIKRHFKVFASSFIYESLPSVYIRIIDLDCSDLISEVNFENRNELQVLRSFANIATFTQDNLNDSINWSSEAGSVLGINLSSVSLQEDLLKYILPEDKANFEKIWVESIINKRDVICKFRIKNNVGDLKYLYLFANIDYLGNEITKIKGFIQDISKITNYKLKYHEIKDIDQIPLKSVYSNSEFLSKLLLMLIDKESKFSSAIEVLEKTRNRLSACKLAYNFLTNSAKFKINLKTFFDKYIRSIYEFYDISHINLKWDVDKFFIDSSLILSISFSVNEILAEILKHVSPQVIETIKINISKKENYIKLVIWTDLIFYDEKEISKEFIILKSILKLCEVNDYNIEVNNEGTLFDINFIL